MPEAFVIHIHSGFGPTHCDLMLQHGRTLLTWRLAADPAALAAGRRCPARPIQDHRPAYLDYEGPIGGERGRVRRLDGGTWQLLRRGPARWEFRLAGGRLSGRFCLRRAGDGPDEWEFAAAPDEGGDPPAPR